MLEKVEEEVQNYNLKQHTMSGLKKSVRRPNS